MTIRELDIRERREDRKIIVSPLAADHKVHRTVSERPCRSDCPYMAICAAARERMASRALPKRRFASLDPCSLRNIGTAKPAKPLGHGVPCNASQHDRRGSKNEHAGCKHPSRLLEHHHVPFEGARTLGSAISIGPLSH